MKSGGLRVEKIDCGEELDYGNWIDTVCMGECDLKIFYGEEEKKGREGERERRGYLWGRDEREIFSQSTNTPFCWHCLFIILLFNGGLNIASAWLNQIIVNICSILLDGSRVSAS